MATKTELTEREIRYATGASTADIKRWLGEGLLACRTSDDNYDARKFFLWYRDNVYRPSLGKGDTGVDLDVTAHKARYEKARAQKYQIRLKRLMDGLISIDAAELALYELQEVFEEISKKLPKMIAKKVAGKDEAEIMMKTDEYIRKILINYSKLGDDSEDSEDKKEE